MEKHDSTVRWLIGIAGGLFISIFINLAIVSYSYGMISQQVANLDRAGEKREIAITKLEDSITAQMGEIYQRLARLETKIGKQ